MAETSSIEWTDATWNPVTGCSVVSPGCTNCYAMKLAGTRLRHHPSRVGLTRETKAGPVWTGEVRVNWQWIDQPLSWAKPRNIFVCAHGDLFHDAVPWEDIAVIYGVMIAAHHLRGHILQTLTKRIGRARELLRREDFWEVANAHASAEIMERVDCLNRRSDDARATCEDYGPNIAPPGIWLGTSVEDQKRADERIPDLLATPAAVRFLSCEPLLGRVWPWHHMIAARAARLLGGTTDDVPGIDWIICGGESGRGARPMHPDWARSLRDQCAAAGVPFFFKQWGTWRPVGPIYADQDDENFDEICAVAGEDKGRSCIIAPNGGQWPEHQPPDGSWVMERVGKKNAGRLLDGVEHSALPARLQVILGDEG